MSRLLGGARDVAESVAVRLDQLPAPPPGLNGWPWTKDTPVMPPRQEGGTPWPRITIVTPSYNQGRFLEETIRSVLLQGYPNLEYIIMDGGSSDESVAIIQKYSTWLRYWESGPDGGQSAAINRGFSFGTGAILGWLNSDDFLLPGALATVGRALTKGDVKLITGSQLVCDLHGKFTGWSLAANNGLRPNRYSVLVLVPQLHQAATFWTRSLWEDVGATLNEDLHFAMDADLWIRMLATSPRVAVTRQLLAVFRRHAEQKTSAGPKYYLEAKQLAETVLSANSNSVRFRIALSLERIRCAGTWHLTRHPRIGLAPKQIDHGFVKSLGRA